jgi:uncharacterized membrane protein HdeD (DUF308 family)
MNSETGFQRLDADILRQNLGWFIALGIGLIILGIISVLAPLFATFAIKVLIGALFVIGGIMHFIHAFQSRRWERSIVEFLVAILYIAAGIILLAYPFGGILALTVFLSVFFVVEGVSKIVHALRLRPVSSWGWTLLSGIVSVFLGLIIWAGLPMTAFWAVGLIVGIDLIFGGLSMVMIAISMRDALQEMRPFCIGTVCFQ